MTTSPAEPSKAPTSCNECRARKRKCDRTWPCQNCVTHARSCLYSDPGRRGPPLGWTTTCLTRALEAEAALSTVLSMPGVLEIVERSRQAQGSAALNMQASQDARSLEDQWRRMPLGTLDDVVAFGKRNYSQAHLLNGLSPGRSKAAPPNDANPPPAPPPPQQQQRRQQQQQQQQQQHVVESVQRGRSLPRSISTHSIPSNAQQERPSPPRRFHSALYSEGAPTSLDILSAYASDHNMRQPEDVDMRDTSRHRSQSQSHPTRTTSVASTERSAPPDSFYQDDPSASMPAEDWEQDFW